MQPVPQKDTWVAWECDLDHTQYWLLEVLGQIDRKILLIQVFSSHRDYRSEQGHSCARALLPHMWHGLAFPFPSQKRSTQAGAQQGQRDAGTQVGGSCWLPGLCCSAQGRDGTRSKRFCMLLHPKMPPCLPMPTPCAPRIAPPARICRLGY